MVNSLESTRHCTAAVTQPAAGGQGGIPVTAASSPHQVAEALLTTERGIRAERMAPDFLQRRGRWLDALSSPALTYREVALLARDLHSAIQFPSGASGVMVALQGWRPASDPHSPAGIPYDICIQIAARVFPQWEVVQGLLPPLLAVVEEEGSSRLYSIGLRSRYREFEANLATSPADMDGEGYAAMRAEMGVRLDGIYELCGQSGAMVWHTRRA